MSLASTSCFKHGNKPWANPIMRWRSERRAVVWKKMTNTLRPTGFSSEHSLLYAEIGAVNQSPLHISLRERRVLSSANTGPELLSLGMLTLGAALTLTLLQARFLDRMAAARSCFDVVWQQGRFSLTFCTRVISIGLYYGTGNVSCCPSG